MGFTFSLDDKTDDQKKKIVDVINTDPTISKQHKEMWDSDESYRKSFKDLAPLVDPKNRPYVEERGILGDIGSNIARGTADLVRMGGYALKTADPDGGTDVVEKLGQGLIDTSKKAESWDVMKPDASEAAGEGFLKRGVMSGFRSAPASLAPSVIGGAAGFAFGGPVGMFVGAGLGTLGLFGLGTYGERKQEYTDARDRGEISITDDEIDKAAMKQGLIEGGGEMVASMLGLAIMGPEKIFAQPLMSSVQELLRTPAKELVKKFAGTALEETITEMIQEGSQAQVETGIGLREEGAWQEAAVEAIVPAITMSLLFGGASESFSAVKRHQLKRNLNNMEDQAAREKAVEEIEQGIRSSAKAGDPAAKSNANAWVDMALDRIANNQPIELNEDFVRFAQLDEQTMNGIRENAGNYQTEQYLNALDTKISNLQKIKKPTPRMLENLNNFMTERNDVANRYMSAQQEKEAQQQAESLASQGVPFNEGQAELDQNAVEYGKQKAQEESFKRYAAEAIKQKKLGEQFQRDHEAANKKVEERLASQQESIASYPDTLRSERTQRIENEAKEAEYKARIEADRKAGKVPADIGRVKDYQDIITEGSPRNSRINRESQALDIMVKQSNDSQTRSHFYDETTGENVNLPATSPGWMKEIGGKLSRKEIENLATKYKEQVLQGKTDARYPITEIQQAQIDKYIIPAINRVQKDHADEFITRNELEKDGYKFVDKPIVAFDFVKGDTVIGFNGYSGTSEVIDSNDNEITIRTPDNKTHVVDGFDSLNITAFKEGYGKVSEPEGYKPEIKAEPVQKTVSVADNKVQTEEITEPAIAPEADIVPDEKQIEQQAPVVKEPYQMTKEEFSDAVYKDGYDFTRLGIDQAKVQKSVRAYHKTTDPENKAIAKASIDAAIDQNYKGSIYKAFRDGKIDKEQYLKLTQQESEQSKTPEAITPETKVDEVVESQATTQSTGIDDNQKAFVEKKISSLGSIAAVDNHWSGNDAVSEYAKTRAREVFGTDVAPIENQPVKEETPVPTELSTGSKVQWNTSKDETLTGEITNVKKTSFEISSNGKRYEIKKAKVTGALEAQQNAETVTQSESDASTRRKGERETYAGFIVEYTGVVEMVGKKPYDQFIYIDGHKKGKVGLSPTKEEKLKQSEESKQQWVKEQEDFRRLRESTQKVDSPQETETPAQPQGTEKVEAKPETRKDQITRWKNALNAYVNDGDAANARTDTLERAKSTGLVKDGEETAFEDWLINSGARESIRRKGVIAPVEAKKQEQEPWDYLDTTHDDAIIYNKGGIGGDFIGGENLSNAQKSEYHKVWIDRISNELKGLRGVDAKGMGAKWADKNAKSMQQKKIKKLHERRMAHKNALAELPKTPKAATQPGTEKAAETAPTTKKEIQQTDKTPTSPQTLTQYLEDAKAEIGNDQDFNNIKSSLTEDHYKEIEEHVKSGGKISQEIYDSLDKGKQYHFAKHYNVNGEAIIAPRDLYGEKRRLENSVADGETILKGKIKGDKRTSIENQVEKEKTKLKDVDVLIEEKEKKTNETPKEGLQDFGEKLGGAKKDNFGSVEKDYKDNDISTMPLSQIWPKNDIDSVEDIFQAAVLTVARGEIPSKPRVSYKLKRWVESVRSTLDLIPLLKSKTRDEFLGYLQDNRVLKPFAAKVLLLEKIDRKQWDSIGKVNEYPNAYSYDSDGKKVIKPIVYVEVNGKQRAFSGVKSVLDVENEIRDILNKSEVKTKSPEMKFEVRGSARIGFSINKKGDSEYRPLKSFLTSKEAFAFIKENHDSLVAAWERAKEKFNVSKTDVRGEENRQRQGKDYRNGKDVTDEMFQDAFGFRGVEFGNWVSQGKKTQDRQWMLNNTYDALSDLADILGIPTKAMSLNGTLGLGLGSRGSGSAAAHYEPSNLIINLTKTKGAGALAHEWFHALDNYFRRERGENLKSREGMYITYEPETVYVHKTGQRLAASRYNVLLGKGGIKNPSEWTKTEGVRPEVGEAFANLVNTLNASPMSKRVSGIKSKYWSRIIERAARSFENYIIEKMTQGGYHNDFLANVVDIKEFKRDEGRYPYLLQEEIAPIEKAFDDLFSVIKTRETDKGTALYSTTSVKPWAKDFPNVVANTTLKKVTEHPDHKAAKAGDIQAAIRLVDDLLNNKKILELKNQFPNAMVVSVHAVEESGKNKIPEVMADAYNAIGGFTVDTDIVQSNKTGHTKKDALQRLLSRAKFDGKVIKGQEYIILDDIVTTGETLSELKHYIENNGGKVVAASTLGFSKFSTILAVKPETLSQLRSKFNEAELKNTLREFDIAGELEALTQSEAKYILSFNTVDTFRNRIIEAGQEGNTQDRFSIFQQEVWKEELKDSQSSPTNTTTTPGKEVNLASLQKYFADKNQTTGINSDGSLWVRLQNGTGFNIGLVDRFSDAEYQMAIASGAMDETGHIAGQIIKNNIKISTDFGNMSTLDHELVHLMENSGILTESDTMVLDGQIRKMNKNGELKFNVSGDKMEDRANFLAQVLAEREKYRGTALGKVLQKIADFIDSLIYIGRQSSGKIARGMETGKIYSITPSAKAQAIIVGGQSIWGVPGFKQHEIKAWHGSPHVIEGGFNDDKIGSGEGVQAFGSGHYMTDAREIGEAYANMNREIVDGETLPIILGSHPKLNSIKDKIAFLIEDFRSGASIDDINDLRSDLEDAFDNKWVKTPAPIVKEIEKLEAFYNRKLKDVEKISDGTTRNLYDITIHKGKAEDQYDYIEWYKPLSDTQKTKLRDALKAKGISKNSLSDIDLLDRKVSLVYRGLSKELGSPKAATQFLLGAGIDGIKFPAGTLSQWKGEQAVNYVVFDPKEITINERIQYQNVRNTDTKAFKDWFKNSKVVDDAGNPLVVYHGTRRVFHKFDGRAKKAHQTFKPKGFQFTNEYSEAEYYTEKEDADYNIRPGDNPNIMPVYLKITNPLIVKTNQNSTNYYDSNQDDIIRKMESNNYDGIIIEGSDLTQYIVFKSTQIKSINNQGTFDPNNPDIRYSIVSPAQQEDPLGIPDKSSLFDSFKYALVNRLDPIAKLQKAIGNVPENADLLAKETLRISKAKAAIDRSNAEYVTPIEKLMAKNKFALDSDVGKYLHSRHAPEANERLKYTNAKKWLLSLDKLRNSTDLQQKIKAIDAYLEMNPFADPKTLYYQELENEINNFDPDNEFEMKFAESWRDFSSRASGMTNEEAKKIQDKWKSDARYPAMQSIAALFDKMNQEKLDISLAAGRMTPEEHEAISGTFDYYAPLHREGFDSAPNIGRGLSNMGRDFMARGGSTREVVDILANAISDYQTTVVKAHKAESTRAFMNLVQLMPEGSNFIKLVKPNMRAEYDASGNIRMVIAQEIRQNQVKFKLDGITYLAEADRGNEYAQKIIEHIKFNPEKTGWLIENLNKVNRVLAMVNTSMNPEFMISNFLRDMQTAAINLSDTEVSSMTKQIMLDLPKAIKGLHSAVRGDNSHAWADTISLYNKSGAPIGWMDNIGDMEQKVKNLNKEIDSFRPAKDFSKGKRILSTGQRSIKKAFDVIMDYNSIVENAVRLSTFKSAIDAGISTEKAAVMAKGLTVNFTQKGTMGAVVNSLWLFSNAGIQGSAKILSVLANSKRARQIVGASIMVSAGLAIANRSMGDDDDDGIPFYDKIDAFVKERNIIIMRPGTKGKYWHIPLPWGYNVFWALGEELGMAYAKDRYSVMNGASRMLTTTLNAFNPLQSATIAQTISPTITDPFVNVAENKSWSGSPLMPEGDVYAKTPTPDSQKYWQSARKTSVYLAQLANQLSLGNEVKPGLIDISPETLDLVWDTFTGGSGKFVANAINVPAKMVAGEELTTQEIPFLRRFSGEKSEYADSNLFRKNVEHVYQLKEQFERYPEQRKELMQDKAFRLIPALKSVEKEIRRMNKIKKNSPSAVIKENAEKRIENLKMKFNGLYDKMVA